MTPGQHSFHIKARDRAGNIDPSPAHISFTVFPPIWKQLWFISMISLFLITILTLLVALGINNQRLSHANQEISTVSAFKENFYLNISHELRTPLTMIIASLSQLTAKTGLKFSNISDQLSVMKQHSHYLLRLVNQLLEFRKIESRSYPIRVQEGDLGDFIQQIKKRFEPFAQQHAINLTLKVSDVKTGWFDPNNLETILVNLIGNALKYTPDSGSISISVKSAWHSFIPALNGKKNIGSSIIKNCHWIRLQVADTGIGIPKERLLHIFDRFYHVEHPGKLYYDSIGIGLDLTKEIVELNHGTITVESEEGKGSLFTVNLPIDKRCFADSQAVPAVKFNVTPQVDTARMDEILEERQRLLAPPGQSTNEQSSHSNTKAPLLLIVEDHPDLRHLLFSFLNDSYSVLQADNGQEGLDLAREHIPNLIISDVMMPKMDGMELTRILKNDIKTSHIPVILLTVKHETVNRILGFEIGADDYLSKPFEYEELRVRIENLINNRKKLQQRFSKEIHVQPKDITITSLDAGFLEKCISIIEENIDEAEFNVDLFCKKIGMSRTLAYQKVKSISGFSLKEFITHIKLKRAAQYLVDSDMNVGEIAYTLHFSDHAHLSRLFKKAFGLSPLEYRKQHKK
jgi:signal transduction histidine kinase/DNA-binding response OmpR family regulator